MIHQTTAALALFALAIMVATQGGRRVIFGAARADEPGTRRFAVAIFLASAWGCLFSEITGAKHDYLAYREIWQAILAGLPPWGPHSKNTYGPAFNALAIPFGLDPFLPKVLFNIIWLATAIWLAGLCVRKGSGPLVTWGTFVLLLCCPYVWAQFPRHGLNDGIPATLCVLAVAFVDVRRPILAGMAIALGTLFKIYPIALLPFLFFDFKQESIKIRWSVAISTVSVIVAGLFLSWLMWGGLVTAPFTINAGRPSTYLSIFYTLRAGLPMIPAWFGKENLDFLSLPAMGIATATVLAFGYWKAIATPALAAAGMGVVMLMYKVGHPNFLLAFLYITCYWLIASRIDLKDRRSLAIALALYWGWLSLVESVYPLTKGFTKPPWDRVWPMLGLPSSILGVFLVGAILSAAARAANRSVRDDSDSYLYASTTTSPP
jgi:Glycosyltransferase family 87